MSRLKPINKSPKKQNVFHNKAFVIFCPKHQKIAVSDTFKERRELAIWFPFVYLSSVLIQNRENRNREDQNRENHNSEN